MSHSSKHKGFTLIEFAVSMVIMTIILTVVVAKQKTYADRASLTNLADEINASISQAQVYGIGVKEFSVGSSEFSFAYGLAFSLRTPTGTAGSPTAYLSFVDRNANKSYGGDWTCAVGGTNECLVKTNITRGNVINSLCAVISGLADVCTGGSTNVGRIDISFARPSIEAQISLFDMAGVAYNPANLIGAKIILRSPNAVNKSVIIYKTGQVSVQ